MELTPDCPVYGSLLSTVVGPEWDTLVGSSYDVASDEEDEIAVVTPLSSTRIGAAEARFFLGWSGKALTCTFAWRKREGGMVQGKEYASISAVKGWRRVKLHSPRQKTRGAAAVERLSAEKKKRRRCQAPLGTPHGGGNHAAQGCRSTALPGPKVTTSRVGKPSSV